MRPALAVGLLMTLVTALVVSRRGFMLWRLIRVGQPRPKGSLPDPRDAGRGRGRRGARPTKAAEVDRAGHRPRVRLLGLHHLGAHDPRGLPRDRRPRL